MKATYIPTRSPKTIGEEQINTLKALIGALSASKTSKAHIEGLKKLDIPQTKLCLEKLQNGLTPEKLAACLARYSRSNEGIQIILEKYADKSPDAIFKFVDYGHASIGGLTGGIAIALDDISMLLAYKLFEFAQMADGQESSTRYITLEAKNLQTPAEIGLPDSLVPLWEKTCAEGFRLYDLASAKINEKIEADPKLARIPEKALQNEKIKERMLKNYALDRARYFLPFATKTNAAIVATARIWADTVRLLESLQWNEALHTAEKIRTELKKVAPNLVRHSYADNASIAYVQELQHVGQRHTSCLPLQGITPNCQCRLEVFDPTTSFNRFDPSLARALETRGTRYHHTGVALKRQVVQMEWSHMAIAELRDLNRHRTGFRFSDFAPSGFYVPEETIEALTNQSGVPEFTAFFKNYHNLLRELARKAQPGLHAYGFFLGTQVAFEHTQAADKFLYEVELRTGLGAHFRYAEHLRQAAELYFEKFPETRGHIQLGNAEPE